MADGMEGCTKPGIIPKLEFSLDVQMIIDLFTEANQDHMLDQY